MYWKHNCEKCEYLGSFEFEYRYGNKWDVYKHDHEYITTEYVFRHGDRILDYTVPEKDSNLFKEFNRIKNEKKGLSSCEYKLS